MVIETKAFKNVFLTQIPISLKKAYFEYRYGIFAQGNTRTATFFLKRAKYI